MILGSLFQNGAVLQQGRDIPVWGRTLPQKSVIAVLDGSKAQTLSSADGFFILYLPPQDAGGPFVLTVQVQGDENEKVVLEDILVGEVWLASGQSNMAYKLGSDWRANPVLPADKALGRIQEKQFNEMVMNPEQLRVYTVAERASMTPEEFCVGCWHQMDSWHSADVSAVAVWFGLGLQYQLNVPIGIIDASWGGTIAEAWMSMQALMACPETRKDALEMQKLCRDPEAWQNLASRFYENDPDVHADPGNTGVGMGYAGMDFDDSDWKDMEIPGSWIRQGIAGNGVVWIRKKVEIPESWNGCTLSLQGGAVDKQDVSYFNGVEIGGMGEGFDAGYYGYPRCYPIPAELVKPGVAVVAIRAYSFAYDGAVTGRWHLVNEDTGERIELVGKWRAKAEYDWGVAPIVVQKKPFGIENPTKTPLAMFNGMINPLLPYALRGAIWYQGESNAETAARARAYRDVLQAMIDDWRFRFLNPLMPFIMVQLAGYESTTAEAGAWAELRESQRLLALNDPDTFMASAIDVGEKNDIHPENKLDVGKRLAMSALYHVYGCQEVVPSGPEIVKAQSENSSVRLYFKYAEKLQLKSGDGLFELSGADGVFHVADKVELDDELGIVTVASAAVSEPYRVRYGWKNWLEPVLFNGAGMPASSFEITLN